MTLDSAIAQCDTRRPNQYSREDKIGWLSKLDGRIDQDVLAMCEGEARPFTGYDSGTPGDTQLLAPWPHDEMYPLYLYAMADFHNNDLQRYNASAAMFDRALMEYKAWYIRNHMPKKRASVSYGGGSGRLSP